MASADPTKGTLALNAEFQHIYGAFHLQWATIELIIDFAIGHLLNLDAKAVHLMTTGLEVNRKATILRGIIRHLKHPQQAELLRSLRVIQNQSKRNVFAHSYWMATPSSITFIERSAYNGELSWKSHTFTLKQFREHTLLIETASQDFEKALGAPRDKLVEFVRALEVEVN